LVLYTFLLWFIITMMCVFCVIIFWSSTNASVSFLVWKWTYLVLWGVKSKKNPCTFFNYWEKPEFLRKNSFQQNWFSYFVLIRKWINRRYFKLSPNVYISIFYTWQFSKCHKKLNLFLVCCHLFKYGLWCILIIWCKTVWWHN